KETQGFDAAQLLPAIPKLLFKPEAHQMGQQIAGGLAQRAIARFIREFLLTSDTAHANPPSKQLRLPAAHL
ncbi:MAG TPA: AarF/ABC1/UbiB kinase family protein, partial [Thermosynechococcaceae cyanobacterium]